MLLHLFVTSVNAATAEDRVKLWKGGHRESRRPLQSECLDRIKALLIILCDSMHPLTSPDPSILRQPGPMVAESAVEYVNKSI